MASIINATTTNGVAVQGDNSGSLQLQTNNGTTAVTIDTSQNVGIGTTSPLVTSSGRKVVTLNGTTDAMYNIGVNGTYTGFFYSSASNTQLGSATSIPLQFYTNDTERIRITSDGDVLVGGTGQASAGNSYVTLRGGDNNCISTYRIGTGTRTHNAFYNGTAGSAVLVGTIQTSGSNTSYNTSSDYRLKENIAPMTGALDKIAQLKPVTYKWKVDGSDGQGFIAHELQAVVPDCVTGEKDAVDEEGKPIYQGVDTSFLVATLTAAIQELKAELDTVKAELNTLKNPPVEGTE